MNSSRNPRSILLQEFNPNVHDEVMVSFSEASSELNVEFLLSSANTWSLESPYQLGEFVVGLWEHSCFEVFEFEQNSTHYVEWNMSASGAFWFCRFEDYRKPLEVQEVLKPKYDIQCSLENNKFILKAQLPRAFENSTLQFNTVLKDLDARLYYFAQRHPAHKADFHLKLL